MQTTMLHHSVLSNTPREHLHATRSMLVLPHHRRLLIDHVAVCPGSMTMSEHETRELRNQCGLLVEEVSRDS